MRHQKSGVKLNRTSSHRKAMFRNMVTSLLKHDRIRTTDAKAKELRRWADHLVTLAKRGDLHARRQAMSIVREKDVVHKLFEEAPKRFGTISGGYTRIIKVGLRPGDAASMSMIELVDAGDHKAPKKAKKKAKAAKPAEKKATAESAPTEASDDTAAESADADAKAAADAETEDGPADEQQAAADQPEETEPTEPEPAAAAADEAAAEESAEETAEKKTAADDTPPAKD